MLSRWTGFGAGGASLIGLLVGISLVGWFGIQTGVSAAGLNAIFPSVPVWVWSILFGLLVTIIVARGFHGMQWVANIAVPLFLILVGWAIWAELKNHSLAQLITSPAPGPSLNFVAGTTMVAGGFIVGAIITPDMTRFNRNVGDVVKQTLVGVTLGEYVVGLAGVILAHAAKTAEISGIIMSSVGWVGILIIVLGTIKVNDWNLYSSGLGIVNFIDTVFHKKVNRGVVAVILGVTGSLLSAVGILGNFQSFLSILGVAFPPIAGIQIAEYFIVKKWREQLSNAKQLPNEAPVWVPATIIIWIVSSLIGYFVTIGIPSINSLVISFVLYVVAGKLGWIKGVGVSATATQSKEEQQ